jgi:hypothetical protein
MTDVRPIWLTHGDRTRLSGISGPDAQASALFDLMRAWDAAPADATGDTRLALARAIPGSFNVNETARAVLAALGAPGTPP